MELSEEWIRDALIDAYSWATDSPDPSTQNGAVAYTWNAQEGLYEAMAHGINTFTPGIEVTPEKLERPLKYSYVEHAERNCCYACVRSIAKPTLMVAPWAACTECARAIVMSGFRTLVRHQDASDRSPERWVESIAFADNILLAGGVEIIAYEGKLNAPSIMHCEELWTP